MKLAAFILAVWVVGTVYVANHKPDVTDILLLRSVPHVVRG